MALQFVLLTPLIVAGAVVALVLRAGSRPTDDPLARPAARLAGEVDRPGTPVRRRVRGRATPTTSPHGTGPAAAHPERPSYGGSWTPAQPAASWPDPSSTPPPAQFRPQPAQPQPGGWGESVQQEPWVDAQGQPLPQFPAAPDPPTADAWPGAAPPEATTHLAPEQTRADVDPAAEGSPPPSRRRNTADHGGRDRSATTALALQQFPGY